MERDIAIIGMSALFAGARNLDEYWSNIVQELDCITEVPDSRWRIEDYYSPDPLAPDKSYSKVGGFIPEVNFNPMEFGLPPNIIELTDTSQLLSLVTAKAALEDAGYWQSDKFSKELRKSTGVILGVGGGQKLFGSLTSRLQYPIWERVLKAYGVPEKDLQAIIEQMKAAYVKWEENTFPGLLGNVIAGRITNRFDLGGTNCVVDAACAASLSAVKMAVMELQLGHVDMMITGGVDTDNTPGMYLSFSKTPAFSRKNKIRPFDEDSDGIVISEGVGMVVLKRLSDAVRDGDRIYSVIKGIGSSSDGKNKSIYAPQSAGQVIAFERAYKQAGFGIETIGYVECHGTGTAAGDPSEVSALKMLFDGKDSEETSIALGSIKSQIGHAKAAAGAASLIKTSLALYNKVLPPSINVSKPNPKLELDSSPFYINTLTRPWIKRQDLPRRAAVSAFGFGGTNFHVVMEEYDHEHTRPYRSYTSSYTILYAGATRADLIGKLNDLSSQLSAANAADVLQDIDGRNRQNSFSTDNYNVGFVAATPEQALKKVQAAVDYLRSDASALFEHPKGFFYTEKNTAGFKVAALFPGQGTQYVNMAKDMACHFPPFREAFYKADQLSREANETPISSIVYPGAAYTDDQKAGQDAAVTKTENAQPAIGAVSVAYYNLYKNAGFKPDMVAGHSFGELTALWAAGVFDEDTFLKLARERGKCMKKQPEVAESSMLAVSAELAVIKETISAIPDVTIANINAPKQIILGGPVDSLQKALAAFKAQNILATLLPVSAAFHTPYVAHASRPFGDFMKSQTFAKPSVPVYSNSTGKKYPKDGDKIKKSLDDHMLNPVYFMDEINEMYSDGARVFIEFGPKAILTGLVKEILHDKPHYAFSVNTSTGNSEHQFREAYIKMLMTGLVISDPDVYKVPAKKAPQAEKLNVVLSGANYLSEGTQKAYKEGLARIAELNPFAKAVTGIPDSENGTGALSAGRPRNVTSVSQPTMMPDAVQETVNRQVTAFKKILNVLEEQIAVLEGKAPAATNDKEFVAGKPLNDNKTTTVPEPQILQPVTVARKHSAFSMPANKLMDTLFEVVSDRTGYPTEMLEMGMDMEADLGIDSIKRVEIFGAMQEAFPTISGANPKEMASIRTLGQIVDYLAAKAGTAQSTAPAQLNRPLPNNTPSTLGTSLVSQSLLQVVSDKTGYPTEMLEFEMDMEADLGIDSIKRVEIFGAMQEAFPHIKGANPKEMALLKTLGQIVEYLGAKTQVSNSAVTTAFQPMVATSAVAQQGGDLNVLTASLLQVVSDKTGYPAEMLEMGMDMEADLGIDSIKRVEIFGAMQEAFPGTSGANPREMALLKTLGQIVEYLGAKIHGGGSVASTASSPLLVAKTSDATQSVADVETMTASLLQIVSDKTGYPAEMLEMGMDMEADLGIDSIKRVEIFGAMQETFPGITGANPKEMALLKTLGQIVDYLGSKKGSVSQEVTPAIDVKQTVPVQSIKPDVLTASLLQIVSDKTGYPAEMLDLGMDMEADLGIDSIKRVEIFGAMQEAFPMITGANPKDMALLKTLGQIIDYLGGRTSDSSGEQAPAPVSQTQLSSLPSSGLDLKQLTSSLLQIVSDKTGYPSEMLELTMDMEADLGIDSIKRVEIFGAMQEAFPHIKGANPKEMALLKTLGQIVEYLGSKIGCDLAGENVVSRPDSVPLSGRDEKIKHYTTRLKYLPRPDKLHIPWSKRDAILITDNGSQITGALIMQLLNLPVTIIVLHFPNALVQPAVTIASEHVKHVSIDEISDAAIEKAMQEAYAYANAINAVIYVPDNTVLSSGNQVFADEPYVKAAFFLAKHFKRTLDKQAATESRNSFVCVTSLDGALGFCNDSNEALVRGAYFGLIKTLSLEWSDVFCRAIDIHPSVEADEAASIIFEELHDPNGAVREVSYSETGTRQTIIADLSKLAGDAPHQASVTPNDVFLVTGGGKGITSRCIVRLAQLYHPKFILIGRSSAEQQEPDWANGITGEKELKKSITDHLKAEGIKPTPSEVSKRYRQIVSAREIADTLNALKAAGSEALYYAADVRDGAQLKQVIADASGKLGPVTGFIHGAGALADKLIENKTEQDFDTVYSIKVRGLFAALDALDEQRLKYVLLFSSVAGFYGNPGQSDYALSNEILNKTALFLAKRLPVAKVVSYNWGPWDAGMVSDELKRQFEERNVFTIPLDLGADMFVGELGNNSHGSQVVIGSPLPVPDIKVTLPLKMYRISRKLQLDKNPFLQDHVIAGNAVLPVVNAISWIAESCRQLYPGMRIFRCDEPVVYKGIVFDKGFNDDVLLELEEKDKHDNEIVFSCVLSSDNDKGRRIIHYKALITLRKVIGSAPIFTQKPKMSAAPKELSADKLYTNGTLFHGPSFRGIQEVVSVDDNELLIKCHLDCVSESVQGQFPFVDVNSFILDVQYQGLVLLARHLFNVASLPVRIMKGEFFMPMNFGEDYFVYVSLRHSSPTKMIGDIWTYNTEGQICAKTEGAEIVLSAELNDAFLNKKLVADA